MGHFRLHIDIPLPLTEEEAIIESHKIMSILRQGFDSESFGKLSVEEVNYRLGHDDDRQKSNYFNKNENGHVSNKKSKVLLNPKNQIDDGLTAVDDVV